MSPEQARGKPVDRRSDIWAFGCVLFEMKSFQADKAQRWSDGAVLRPRGVVGTVGRSVDVHPHSDRVAMAAQQQSEASVTRDTVVFIINFFDELRRLAPTST